MSSFPTVDQLITTGLDLLQNGDVLKARDCFQEVLVTIPNEPDALNFLGVCQHKFGDTPAAVETLRRAVESDPLNSDAFFNFGQVLRDAGHLAEAEHAFARCVRLDPAYALAWRQLAQTRSNLNDDQGAAEAAEAAADLQPNDLDLNTQAARLSAKAGRPAEVVKRLLRVTTQRPNDLPTQTQLFEAAMAIGDTDVASRAIDLAAMIEPFERVVLNARTQFHLSGNRLAQAVESSKAHLRAFPKDPEAHFNLGLAFQKQDELGGAALAYAAAIEHDPEHAITYVKLGEVLLAIGRISQAVETLRQAVELDPAACPAHVFLSMALDRTPGSHDEAMSEAATAAELDQNDLYAGNWYATLLSRRGRHADATEQYRRLLSLDPDHVSTLTGYGSLLAARGQIESAWTYLARAIELSPNEIGPLTGALFFANANPAMSPAELADLHHKWAERQRLKRSAAPFDSWNNSIDPERRIRVGYLSPDFRSHSVSNFLQPLMAAHDKSKVDVVVLDNTPRSDEISLHLHSLADRWVRIVGGGVERVCEIVRELQIDILVDLAGHTADNRLDVFSRHPAPIQVSYLGYPNTTGLTEMDYRLTDAIADPPGEADRLHSETLVRLPDGFLCFNPPPPTPDVGPLPALFDEHGRITFTSFNAVHKINHAVIELWTRVLDAVPGSRLLLKAVGLSDELTRRELMASFAEFGVSGDRLELVERTNGYAEHLQVYNRCDIALDTSPYNGTTTTCEALYMGVPVVVLAGDRHAARVGLSIVTQLGMPELAGLSADEYVQVAAQLAVDLPRLCELRRSLRTRMRSSKLMDGPSHTRQIETAYRGMWQTWCERPRSELGIGSLPPAG